MAKKCPPGKYYCFDDKKCKKIPRGYHIGARGYLARDTKDDDNETKKNGNGNSNGNGNGGNGSGNGNGGSGGNGGGNGSGGVGESIVYETLNSKDKPFIKKLVGKLRKGSKTHAKQADDLEKSMNEESNPRIPRKKGQPAKSKKHSDLYTDEDPKGTIHGLGFKDVAKAKASVSKIRNSSRSHAHKIQAAVAMEQRAREMGKTSEAAVYRKYINAMKKKTKSMNEATMTPVQKRKDTMLKKKYDKSDMKKSMQKQYGKEEGKKVYFATIRKQAMEEVIPEAKVDKGRSDYGKASIRNYRRMGPGHDTPGMFDPEGKRGKTIDKRREEHKARRGVKGVKVPAYKVDEGRLASLERASVLAMSDKPEDQDKAREIKTRFDYQSLKRQMKKSTTKESVEDIKDDKYNVSEEGLRDWFGKSSGTTKSGRKVKGWVQVGGKYDGKPCARQPGQKSTPKCVSSSKRRSMSDKERDSAARRKRAADPNQPQKSGAAKPTNVSTDPKKKMKESFVNEAKDKKGKGSGTKDACYHKVKSRYSVWPSAYASGALVKCRKVGAANWGNKSKNEGFSPMQVSALEAAGMIEIKEGQKCWKGYEKKGTKMMFGKRYNNCVKKKATKEEVEIQEMGNPSFEVKQTKTQKLQNMSKTDGPEGKIAKKKLEQKKDKEPKLPKLESYAPVTEGVAFLKKEKEKKNSSSKYLTQRDAGKLAKRVMAKKDQEKVNFLEPEETNESKTKLIKNGHTYKVVLTWRGKTYMVQMFVPSVSRPTRQEVEKEIQKLYPDARVMSFLPRDLEPGEPTVMMGEEKRDEYGDIVGGPKMSKKQKAKNLAKNEKDEQHTTTTSEEYVTEDDMKGMSVKSGHKRPTKAGAGMTAKGVAAYRRRNPGSKLKTAVTTKPSKLKKGSKAANRRKSYCARSAGQMKKFPKAAKDPNSRLRQARRRWNC